MKDFFLSFRKSLLTEKTLLVLSLAISLAYFARLWLGHDHPVDFRYFWAAGKLWSEGYNPYSEQFATLSLELFGFEGMHRWFYVPHAWAIARPISTLDFDLALTLWRTVGVISTALAVLLLSKCAFSGDRRRQTLAFIIMLPVASASQASSINFSIGQFSAFSFLAVSAFIAAATGPRRWLLVPALIVLTMKASVALPFVAFSVMVPRLRLPLLAAGIASCLLAAPGLFPGGLIVTFGFYQEAVSAYSDYAVNAPPDVSGVRNIYYYWTGDALSPIMLTLWASVLGALLGLAFRRGSYDEMRLGTSTLIAVIIFLVQQHSYDWMIFLTLLAGWKMISPIVIILAALISFRPNVLTSLLGVTDDAVVFYGSRLMSLASLALFIYAMVVLVRWAVTRQTSRRELFREDRSLKSSRPGGS